MNQTIKDYSFPLLIVEDDPNDIELLQRVLKKTGTTNPVRIMHDAEAAIEYLSGNGQYADRLRFPEPRLIISDINMPRGGGFMLMAWLRQNPHLQAVPILILTASYYKPDIARAFEAGAHGYFVKPLRIDDFEAMFEAIHTYWALSRTPEQEMMPG